MICRVRSADLQLGKELSTLLQSRPWEKAGRGRGSFLEAHGLIANFMRAQPVVLRKARLAVAFKLENARTAAILLQLGRTEGLRRQKLLGPAIQKDRTSGA